MSSIVEAKNLSFGYTKNVILKALDFEVAKGEFLAIAGPNGAGKTTLLNLLCGSLKPKTGSVAIDSKNIKSYSVKKLAQKVAVVPQEFVPVFDFTVEETVAMARTPYWTGLRFETDAERKIVAEALEVTETIQFASRPLRALSGGERQRVFIARALAQDTDILLLDEPTSFLDMKHQVGIYDLLKTAQIEKSKTIIVVTHDINLAGQYSDQVLLMNTDGSYLKGSPGEVFTLEQLEKCFGVSMVCGRAQERTFFLALGKFTANLPPKP